MGTKTDALVDVFSPSRWKARLKAKCVKCTASEAISTHSMIAHFARNVWLRAGICTKECEAYLAC
eukprot:8320880-Pyramimonas_sp.AAC.1